MTAAPRSVLRIKAEMQEGVVVFAGYELDIAAPTAIAAARAAPGNEFLPAKCQTAIAAIAGFNANADFVDEQDKNRFLTAAALPGCLRICPCGRDRERGRGQELARIT